MLNQVGMNPVLAEDSKFGPQTKSAVLAFQRHAKIKVDGLVGSETLGALKVALKPAAPDVSDKIHSVSKKKTKSISPPKMPSAAVGLKAPPVPSYELTRRTRPAGPLGLRASVGLTDPDEHQFRDDISKIQARLAKHGYLSKGDFYNGIIGDSTVQAILHFQKDQLGFDDGRVEPAGATATALTSDTLAKAKSETYQKAVQSPEPQSWQSSFQPVVAQAVQTPPAPVRSESDHDAAAWTKSNLAQKTFMAHEPKNNMAGVRMPPWFNVGAFCTGNGLVQTDAAGQKTYSALTGALSGYSGGELKSGGALTQTPSQTHFVVHETAGLTDVAARRRSPRSTSVSLFIGRDDAASRNAGHWLANDFSKSKSGTKWQYQNPRDSKKLGFVSVELVTPKIARGAKQTYTDQQYNDLALSYVMASHRAGRLLTVVPHREMDRGIRNGHTDPRNFDWNRFYDRVGELLELPEGLHLGYSPERDKGEGSRNLLSQQNTFPAIYGAIKHKRA